MASNLRLLIKKVRLSDQHVDQKFMNWSKVTSKSRREKASKEFQRADKKLQATFAKFYYKQKVIEESPSWRARTWLLPTSGWMSRGICAE